MTSEHRITVANNQRKKPVEADDAIEESPRHGCGCIRMAERDRVCILGEAFDHCEDDGLAAHLGEALNEVHGDISPHLRGHVEGL
jgi:hypothetical protein